MHPEQPLRIAPELALPAEAITQTFGILGIRGSGKTNTARVMAEEMFRARLPFCVIDPVGAWWGLRSSRDGKGPGLPIPIFGGRHGDIPLERTAGELVADLVAEQRLSCILDISEFSESDKIRFLVDFAERLYRRNTDPLHLFLEEADDYAPQRPMREQARLLRAWENVVRRGRIRGLGITMITQRSAALNKNVLTQIETLIVHRTTSPQDRAAIGAWVEYHGQSRELLESLPALQDGEAWVWSPHWLGRLTRTRIRLSETFDSGATPRDVRGRRAPATLADVDLRAIQERMAATIERAKADDPKALRRRIAELERELAARPTPERVVERVEVPVLEPGVVDKLRDVVEQLRGPVEALGSILAEITAAVGRLTQSMARTTPAPAPRPTTRPAPAAPTQPIPEQDMPTPTGGVVLRAGERRMLATLARRHPLRLTRAQLGTLSGLTPSGGTFNTYLSVLKRHGLVSEGPDGLLEITPAGFAYLGSDAPPAPSDPAEVLEMWRAALRAGERRMLDELVSVYPGWLTREELGARTGIAPTGGTFGTYLSTLRRNGLVDVDGERVRASATLFM